VCRFESEPRTHSVTVMCSNFTFTTTTTTTGVSTVYTLAPEPAGTNVSSNLSATCCAG
jgi:hypothetical protein